MIYALTLKGHFETLTSCQVHNLTGISKIIKSLSRVMAKKLLVTVHDVIIDITSGAYRKVTGACFRFSESYLPMFTFTFSLF